MIDKKILILGFIAVAVLAGIIWYNNQNKQITDDQTAFIAKDDQSILPIVENSSKEQSNQEQLIEEAGLTDDFALGNPNAPVTIIEYSSHTCGHCAVFHSETLPLIIDKYIKNGQVRIINRLVSFQAPVLALAVLCAGEQGGFWQFNKYLFENLQEIKSIDELKVIASTLNLNQDDFNQCFDSEKYEDKVREWFAQYGEDEIHGTPSFLINGQSIIGNKPYSEFEKIIEQELAK